MKSVTFRQCRTTILVLGVLSWDRSKAWGWVLRPSSSSSSKHLVTSLQAVPGADIEQPSVAQQDNDGPVTADSTGGLAIRGKKNEIDFTVAPADVSLSRAYGQPTSSGGQLSTIPALDNNENTQPVMSLTLALNNASNRAVRRIILARSWPSAEALNLSLRQVAEAERRAAQESSTASTADDNSVARCPVPRPILNVLTRKRRYNSATGGEVRAPSPRKSRTDDEYVADQLQAFRDRYGSLPKYEQAEDYLAAVLSLATSGVESPRAPTSSSDSGHAYRNSYRRLLGVLRTVGVVFEEKKETGRRFISQHLNDNDICLSMLDRIQTERVHRSNDAAVEPNNVAVETKSGNVASSVKEKDSKKATDNLQEDDGDAKKSAISKPRIKLFGGNKWKNNNKASEKATDSMKQEPGKFNEKTEEQNSLTQDDLGGVLLSSKEPSMTRQLNVLSNIVLRALLFGGDQELLVLAETLDADRAAFVERWYPNTGGLLNDGDLKNENRPGVQYLNCLIDLLRQCYDNGIVVDLQPSLPLSQSYANAYERLVAMALELGSGYLKPVPTSSLALPKPRTAKEELGRLALWESRFRQKADTKDISPYPEDLEGVWEVRDVIGGETIGTTQVTLGAEGQVIVNPPMEGLRWRLDPGPTHLDTCTFQVLNTDGTILQYRGFIDRGARLEARFSKRAMRIRGSVMFQMRDGSVDYYKDILPINYREGTTKFVMTKVV